MKAIPKCYPTNLTPAQWNLLAPYLPGAKPGGRPRSVNLQAVLNVIFYVLCSGCAWRLLPGDFPAWQTVYTYFRAWWLDGTWERIHRYLRQWIRLKQERPGIFHASPSSILSRSRLVCSPTSQSALTVASKSKAANGTCLSIPLVWC